VTKSAPLHALRKMVRRDIPASPGIPSVSIRGRPSNGFGLVFLLEGGGDWGVRPADSTALGSHPSDFVVTSATGLNAVSPT